jgi:hypothetical protein
MKNRDDIDWGLESEMQDDARQIVHGFSVNVYNITLNLEVRVHKNVSSDDLGAMNLTLWYSGAWHRKVWRSLIADEYEPMFRWYVNSALGSVWAETRAQSGYWYVSGLLHPRQILRGRLPLLSPVFRRSNFRHQVPPRQPRREGPQRRKVELWAKMLSGNFAEMTTSTPFRDLLHATNLRHGTDGFTSPLK